MNRLASILALLLAAPAWATETVAVMAVADPPSGPEPELAEMAHQLRAACRDRVAGVQEVPEMRARLLGQASNATLPELDRAYGGALATYQNGEYQSSIRTLYAIVDDLERLPEGAEAWSQWVRAQLRLAHAEGTVGHVKEEREAMERVLAVDPRHQPDPDQYSPTYRRDFEAARARLAARPRRRLTVDALGWSATIYVNGRASGTAPVTLALPPGRYRIGGSAGTLRVPSLWVTLRDEDRTVSLDFGLAEALRVSAGPGLSLPLAQRAGGVVRVGAWLGVDRLLVTSIAAENQAQFLVGSLHDVRRGALQREGRAVRRVWLEPNNAPAFPPVIRALLSADMILIGPGSLYTSILPNLLVSDLLSALRVSRALKVFVCNIAIQTGETEAYSCQDHIRALEEHIGGDLFDILLCNDNFDEKLAQDIEWVRLDEHTLADGRLYAADLVDPVYPWRHDSQRLAEILFTRTFQMHEELVEEEACYFEHVLSPAMTDSICGFLGHPAACPHGKPIPRGACCAAAAKLRRCRRRGPLRRQPKGNSEIHPYPLPLPRKRGRGFIANLRVCAGKASADP